MKREPVWPVLVGVASLIIAAMAVVCFLVAIWSGDSRWAGTGAVLILVSFAGLMALGLDATS